MGQSKMDSPEKLATQGIERQDQDKQHNAICVGHHYAQANMGNIIFLKIASRAISSDKMKERMRLIYNGIQAHDFHELVLF